MRHAAFLPMSLPHYLHYFEHVELLSTGLPISAEELSFAVAVAVRCNGLVLLDLLDIFGPIDV